MTIPRGLDGEERRQRRRVGVPCAGHEAVVIVGDMDMPGDEAAAGSIAFACGSIARADPKPCACRAGCGKRPESRPMAGALAFGADVTGGSDVWTYDVQRGAVARVPVEGNQDIPVWTPDGSRLAVSSSVSGSGDLVLIDPDGRLPAERLTSRLDGGGAPGSWTADGRALAFTATRFSPEAGTRTRSVSVIGRDGTTESRQLLSDAGMPDISADSR